jgi:phosphatidylserine decarboxylase
MVRDGYKFVAPPLIAGFLVLAFGSRWSVALWIDAVLLFLGAFVAYFFRDPERQIPADAAAIVSPADGRVMIVVDEPFAGRAGRRISIFLAIWNVHVNRAPTAGRIEQIEYRPGRFYAAMRARASAENEQNVIHLSTPRGELVFKQIAGWVARRVVCWKKPGDQLATGERIGLIRFGSRMDVWMPDAVEILVKPGDHVAGGSSILARWK